MIIAIVSEMSRSMFQWSSAFNTDNQSKYGCFVVPVEFSKTLYSTLPKDNPYWNVVRKADLVYVYCTRICDPDEKWRWWELPRYVKGFMKPDAKMICQIDDDWIPMFHPEWSWWNDFPYGVKIPDPAKWFKETGILDVPDMWFTVLENPEFKQYTTKPVKYVPLPQLNRYSKEFNECINDFISKGWEGMHGEGGVGIMRHTSRVGSVQHSLTNVLDKIGEKVIYFSTERGRPTPVESKSPIKIYPYIEKKSYMKILRNECKITLDDTERYLGWSRFVMESAMAYIPCISSNHCGKILFPDLFVEHKDYKKQILLIKKLLKDKEFYNKVVTKAHDNLSLLTDDVFCQTTIDIAKELNVPNTEDFDVKKELFLFILSKFVPHEHIPIRPQNVNDIVYDRTHERMITQEQWDKYYASFNEYINDSKAYKELIREACKRKDKNQTNPFFEIT